MLQCVAACCSAAVLTQFAQSLNETSTSHHQTTGWRRPIGCLKLQVIFRKRATNYTALLRKMTCRDKASYDSTPPCICSKLCRILQNDCSGGLERRRVTNEKLMSHVTHMNESSTRMGLLTHMTESRTKELTTEKASNLKIWINETKRLIHP